MRAFPMMQQQEVFQKRLHLFTSTLTSNNDTGNLHKDSLLMLRREADAFYIPVLLGHRAL